MIAINPTFITDKSGNKISAILSMKEFNMLIDEFEELEDIKLYDEAKKEDTGERILFSEYLKNRKAKNA